MRDECRPARRIRQANRPTWDSACHAAVSGIIALLALHSTCLPSRADSVQDFFRGKTITFYIGSGPGGGYDLHARLVAQFLGQHIPGRPSIVPRNMPGGEGRNAAAYVFTVAAKDGLSIGTSEQSLPLAQVLGDKTVTFDTAKLNWIGNPSTDNKTLVTWHTSGVSTLAHAKVKEVTLGASAGGGSTIYPNAANAMFGTKFKIIRGYPGGTHINLAMEKGEVSGRAGNAWHSWKTLQPDWVRDRKINILFQIGLQKASDLPEPPLLVDLASNPEDRALLNLLSAPTALGHPIYTSPGIPPERLQALRDAFNATMKDPAFIEEARKRKIDVDQPVSGLEIQKIIEAMLSAPDAVRSRLAAMNNE